MGLSSHLPAAVDPSWPGAARPGPAATRRPHPGLGGHARRDLTRGGLGPSGQSTIPERDLIVFLAFATILATLVGQGLTLPLLIRRLGITADGSIEDEELQAREAAADAALGDWVSWQMKFPVTSRSSINCASNTGIGLSTMSGLGRLKRSRRTPKRKTIARFGAPCSPRSGRLSLPSALDASSVKRRCVGSSETSTSRSSAATSDHPVLARWECSAAGGREVCHLLSPQTRGWRVGHSPGTRSCPGVTLARREARSSRISPVFTTPTPATVVKTWEVLAVPLSAVASSDA